MKLPTPLRFLAFKPQYLPTRLLLIGIMTLFFIGVGVHIANKGEATKRALTAIEGPGANGEPADDPAANSETKEENPPPACPEGQTGTPPNCITPQPVAATPKPATAPVVSSGRFNTLGVGAALPSEASCASQVKSAPEIRSANVGFNTAKGNGVNSTYPRVTGNFTGTTDEIIQWAACKWGIDEDMARAQVAKESWWFQRTTGDFTADANACAPGHPIGADGQAGKCPESIGLMQVRYQYHSTAFLNNNAGNSSAYNIDYAYALWRDCFEGNLTWLNTVEKGATYGAGDAWGCFGVWFSGRWMTQPAIDYINAVKDLYNQKVWQQDYFKSAV